MFRGCSGRPQLHIGNVSAVVGFALGLHWPIWLVAGLARLPFLMVCDSCSDKLFRCFGFLDAVGVSACRITLPLGACCVLASCGAEGGGLTWLGAHIMYVRQAAVGTDAQ